MFKSLPNHHTHTFKFLLARLSSSDLACPLIFSVSWWCKLWLPKILEPLPLSSHRAEAHGFWPSLWGSLCSSAPTNNRVFSSDTLHRSCLCQPIPSSRLSETVIFLEAGSNMEKDKVQSAHFCLLMQDTFVTCCNAEGGLSTLTQWHAVIFQNKALLTRAHNFTGKTLHHKQQKEKSGSLVLKN